MAKPGPHKGRRTSGGLACKGKRRFRDKAEAVAATHRINTAGRRQAAKLSAYRCPKCAGWHLTSHPRTDLN